MITGYEKPLDILPFDHRHSYITGVFHWQEPLTPEQVAEIVASKQVIYDGFKAAVADTRRARSRRDPRRRSVRRRPPPRRRGPRLHHVRLHREERAGRIRFRVRRRRSRSTSRR